MVKQLTGSTPVPACLIISYSILVWRPWVVVRRMRRVLSRGFCWLSRARASVFFIQTHSQRETWRVGPCPTGSLTARVLGDSGSAPPWVSTPPSSFVSRHLGPRVRSHTGSSQHSPMPWLRLPPSATPRHIPIQTQGMSTSLTRLLVAFHKITLRRNHTLSLRLVTPLSG